MRPPVIFSALAWVTLLTAVPALVAAEFSLNGQTFSLPEGFEVVSIAGPPLVDRPINAAFDDRGYLYVTDSSGSNDPVQQQVKTRPHRVVRLEDVDGDGVYDQSVVYADQLMFPEGAMWHAGSLYVAAPPEIWKFTDVDGDGKADRREVWFDGKTLTNCANDLHGPYMGRDGWIYWCKGAYAEQSYERVGRSPLVTSASHIFRRHPSGGPIESVMTGGMANPVDVVFTPGGERIFTTTFLTAPHAGYRDGLIHAIYGGVYGQDRPQLTAHPRTGSLMPVLAHLGAAAPSGLVCLESEQLGDDFQHNLMAALFNMQKVTRHVLRPRGATFDSETTDFLVSDNRNFHPTDVIEDADGSLIVVDTGGWYKLCCPTSQLWKPDILGNLYRIRRVGAHRDRDPRGLQLDWAAQTADSLAALLADRRPAVRAKASSLLSHLGVESVASLAEVVRSGQNVNQRIQAVWTLTTLDTAGARAAIREALQDSDSTVRQAALHSVSLHRDQQAIAQLVSLLHSSSPANRRASAEALGRVGSGEQVPSIMSVLPGIEERELEHSLIFAALEIGDMDALKREFLSDQSSIRRAALIAMDQAENSGLTAQQVIPLLQSTHQTLREAAWWVFQHHPEWAPELASALPKLLQDEQALAWIPHLSTFAGDTSIQQRLADALLQPQLSIDTRDALLLAMAHSKLDQLPQVWQAVLLNELQRPRVESVRLALSVLQLQKNHGLEDTLLSVLRQLATDDQLAIDIRMRAMSQIPATQRQFDDETVALLVEHLAAEQPVAIRALALDALRHMVIDRSQHLLLISKIAQIGVMELRSVISILADTRDREIGLALVDSLADCPSITSLTPEELKQQLGPLGDDVLRSARPLFERIERENGELLHKLEATLQLVPSGDIRNGQEIFHSAKAACSACHAAGYLGGRIGPGLMRIGRIRTERDLLEAILFPSASFVQGYEPVSILTVDGQIVSGTVKDERNGRIELQVSAESVITIAAEDIEQRGEGKVSIMPAGLDKQLSLQELADLVAFLKSAN